MDHALLSHGDGNFVFLPPNAEFPLWEYLLPVRRLSIAAQIREASPALHKVK